jgi:hypothetical protein
MLQLIRDARVLWGVIALVLTAVVVLHVGVNINIILLVLAVPAALYAAVNAVWKRSLPHTAVAVSFGALAVSIATGELWVLALSVVFNVIAIALDVYRVRSRSTDG